MSELLGVRTGEYDARVRRIAGALLGLCACGEAERPEPVPEPAPVVVPEPAPPVVEDPWRATLVDERLMYTPQPSLELPMAAGKLGTPWSEQVAAVVVTDAGVGFNGREVLRFVDGEPPTDARQGRVLAPLVTAISPNPRYARPPLVVLADRGMRFERVVDVFYAAARAGWRTWNIALRRADDPAGTATLALEIRPPDYAEETVVGDMAPDLTELDLRVHHFVLAMRISADELELAELWHTGELRLLGRVAREAGWEPVRRLAQAANERRTAGPPGRVVFMVDPGVPLERVVAALTSVRGDECDGLGYYGRDGCWFSRPMLVTGDMAWRELGRGRGSVWIMGRPRYFSANHDGCWSFAADEFRLRTSWRDEFIDPEGMDGPEVVIHGLLAGRPTVTVISERLLTFTANSGCEEFDVGLDPPVTVRGAPLRRGRVNLWCGEDPLLTADLRLYECG